MRVVPVIDLMGDVVVHAVAGQREKYKPVKSVFCRSADPIDIAEAFIEVFGFEELYLADLDAIEGRNEPRTEVYRKLTELGLSVMVDAGVSTIAEVELVLSSAEKAIVATETMRSPQLVEEAVKRFGSSKLVVSIDMFGGETLSKSSMLRSMKPLDALRLFTEMGAEEVIWLDLKRVGTRTGVDLDSIREARAMCRSAKLLVGGGVRGLEDLLRLKEVGVDGVLVATALHRGDITPKDVEEIVRDH